MIPLTALLYEFLISSFFFKNKGDTVLSFLASDIPTLLYPWFPSTEIHTVQLLTRRRGLQHRRLRTWCKNLRDLHRNPSRGLTCFAEEQSRYLLLTIASWPLRGDGAERTERTEEAVIFSHAHWYVTSGERDCEGQDPAAHNKLLPHNVD